MSILERIYLFFYLLKKKRALKNQKRLPFPVISIGNLTLGGTGKTPFTITLYRELEKKGYKPIILTRGYRGRLKGPVLVNKDMKASDVGDEPLMMAMEGLTVVKAIDRYAGGLYAIEKLSLNNSEGVLFLLDDGFQHWGLYRDLNILLIDGYKGFGNHRLVPLGVLRSPVEEILETDMIFITKIKNTYISEKINELGVDKIYFSPLKIRGIYNVNGENIEPKGQKVYAFAGIGDFKSFLHSIESLNLKIIGYKEFIDHKNYSETLLKKIHCLASDAQLIITTKKDLVKIREQSLLSEKICYLEISLEVEATAVEKILSKIS